MSMSETLKAYLSQHDIDYDLVPHPKSYSSKEAARQAHVPDDHVAKAVVVKDGQGYAMVVIPGSYWLKLQALKDESGRDFELAGESDVDRLFSDCQPGAIPPVGPAYGLDAFLDERLTTLANVYFEAGDHENLVHLQGDVFNRLLSGVRHGHFSHDD